MEDELIVSAIFTTLSSHSYEFRVTHLQRKKEKIPTKIQHQNIYRGYSKIMDKRKLLHSALHFTNNLKYWCRAIFQTDDEDQIEVINDSFLLN